MYNKKCICLSLYLGVLFYQSPTIQTATIDTPCNKENYCFAKDEDIYRYFGPLTSYEAVRHRDDGKIFQVPGCSLVSMVLVARHGTRYIKSSSMQAFAASLPVLAQNVVQNQEICKGELCQEDIDNFRKYRFPGNVENNGNINEQGIRDMYYLAMRLKKYFFPELLSSTYDNKLYEFRVTSMKRTEQSALAFAAGLFGENVSVDIPQPLEEDPVLSV